MQSHFEVDRGSYPYSAVRFGEQRKVVHMPTQQTVLDVNLPFGLSAAVALRLNTLHYAAQAGGPAFRTDRSTVSLIAGEEVLAAGERKDISVCR